MVNVVTFLVGAAALGFSLLVHFQGGDASDCQKVLQMPLMLGGIFVMLVSLLGIAGSLCRVNLLLYLYLLSFYVFCDGFV